MSADNEASGGSERIRVLEAENKALRESLAERLQMEDRFRTILDNFKEGYFETDLKGDFTYCSPGICDIAGYSAEELIGKNNREYTPPATARRMFSIFNQVYQTGEPAEITDYDIIDRNGNIHYLEVSAYLIRDAQGEPAGFRGICRDVTDRRRAEAALQESEERFRRLHEASFGGIGIHEKGVILECNRGLSEITGFSYDELIGMNGMALIAPEWRERVMEVIRSDYEKPYVVEGVCKDGTRYPLEIQGKVIRYEGRKVRVTEFRDVTERVEAEAALKESENRYRQLYGESKRAREIYQSLLNSSADAIVLLGMDRNVTYVNPAFTDIFGWSQEELEGKPLPYVPDELAEENDEFIGRLSADGIPIKGMETRRLTKSGGLLDTSLSASRYVDHQGEPAGLLLILRDISENKKLRKHLLQAQKMQSIGTLAGGIAHDFNNLLMGIQGRLSLLMFDMKAMSTPYRHVKEIEEYIVRAADLTAQLLGFARSGKYEVKPTNLNSLIRQHDRMFGRTRKEIIIHEDLFSELRAVDVDRRQIEQVLLNIYVNASQAMANGGEIYVRTENVRLVSEETKPHEAPAGEYVKISVTDTGTGMDEKTRARVFEPFFTTKEMGRGTGLGLASAYGIIKNHQGFMTVYSVVGQGSTFNIYLPVSLKEPLAETLPVEEMVTGEGTLLLVDDEEMIIEVGSEMIASLGYNVRIARSGPEAIADYEANRDEIDLVVLDMIMPGMSGGETFDRLKKIDPDVKILLASGYSINGQATDIMNRGCDGFIQKPFNMLALSRKIGEILGAKPEKEDGACE